MILFQVSLSHMHSLPLSNTPVHIPLPLISSLSPLLSHSFSLLLSISCCWWLLTKDWREMFNPHAYQSIQTLSTQVCDEVRSALSSQSGITCPPMKWRHGGFPLPFPQTLLPQSAARSFHTESPGTQLALRHDSAHAQWRLYCRAAQHVSGTVVCSRVHNQLMPCVTAKKEMF